MRFNEKFISDEELETMAGVPGVSQELFDSCYKKENYLVEYSEFDTPVCAIYFASSGIYNPTNDETFAAAFVKNDKYEWYKNRYPNAVKHIFVRDIAKCFYIYGINERVSSMDKLLDLLKELTEGYEIVTIGSSAGGYAAVFAGMMLNAKKVYCFSGYFDLTLVDRKKWPILMKPEMLNKYGKWYRLENIPEQYRRSCKVIYCFPNRSREDVEQFHVVKNYANFAFFGITNSIHGVSIGEFNIEKLFAAEIDYLQAISDTNLSLGEFTYLINKKDNKFKAYKNAGLFLLEAYLAWLV